MTEYTKLIELVVNESTRIIAIPNDNIVLGVVGDIEVNKLMFKMPRYYCGFDMSEFTPKINYVTPNAEGNYYKSELEVTDDVITFTWLLTSDVTEYNGTVKFSISLYKKENGRVLKAFNSRSSVGNVLEGLNVDTYVTPEQQQTILDRLETEIREDIQSFVTEKSDAAIKAIDTKKNDVLSTIAEKESSTNQQITEKSDAAIKAIDTKKNDVLSTIAEDQYIQKIEQNTANVTSLKEDLDNMHEDLYVKTYNIFDVDFLPRAYISFASSHAGELFLDNNDNYSATNETINVLPNTQYTFSNGSESIPYELQLSVIFYDKDMRFLGYASSSINNSLKYFKFTTIDNTNHLRFQLRSTGKGSDIPNIKKWQLNEGDLLSYLDNYVLNFSTDNIGKELININIDNPQVRDFVKDVDYTNQEYTITQVGTYSAPSVYYRKDCGFPMVVKWKLNRDIKNQILYISTNHSIPIADTVAVKSYDIPCGISDFVVYNLIPNATYYYKVCGTDFDNNLIVIKEGAFTTIGQVHMLKIDGLKNVRDLGGWLTPNGKIKYGLLFRGCELDDTGGGVELTHEGKKELFDRIRIKTDIDLRTDVGNTKSPIGALVDYNCYPIQPYDTGLKDTITKGLIKSIFEKIEEKLSKSNAIYFHCQGGRDRTGTLAFLILGVLGVSESDIAKDYELTEFAYASYKADNPNTSRKFTQYASMVSYIKTFNGVTFNDKIISYLLSIGISQATINNIKSYMVA